MLCSFCEGTENSPLPNAILFHGPRLSSTRVEPDTCADCGASLWTPCPSCIGLGKKLKIIGSCSSCGRSIPYWQACTICQGSGRISNGQHTCTSRKKSLEKAISKVRPVHKQHNHSVNPRGPAV